MRGMRFALRLCTATFPATAPTRGSRNGPAIASRAPRSIMLSESTVTTISPRARRKPSASAPRLPQFSGSRIGVTRPGKRSAARSM